MSALVRKRDLDLTEGSVLPKILHFILPLIITNLLQTFYNAADMMVVSLSHAENAVGAISLTGPFVNLIYNLFMGLSVGANVVVAKHIGAKDDSGTEKALHTSILAGLLFGGIGLVLGQIVAEPVLVLMGVENNLLELALTYVRIVFVGIPFLSLTNCEISIFRAKGDTQTPLFILMLSGVLNVALNLFFVLVCDMAVEGVAIATMIANAVSAIVMLYLLSKQKDACRFSLRKLKMDRKLLREVLYIGIPAGIQGSFFSISNMLIQSSIIKVDSTTFPPEVELRPVVGGNGAAQNLEGFAYTATNSIYQAAVTFTSQNMGAKKYDRVKKIMRDCYLTTFVVAVVVSSIIILLHKPLLSLYGVAPGVTGSPEQVAFESARLRFQILMVPYFLLAFMEVGSGILRGLGKSMTSTIISLAGTCVFRVVWVYTVFESIGTLLSVFLSYPISWTLCAACHFLFALLTLRKQKVKKRETITTEAQA